MLEKHPVAHGVLNQIQTAFLSEFGSLPDAEAFYLTGGTALAEFYLGHRLSYDLDLCTGEHGLIRPFCASLERSLAQSGFSLRPVRRHESFADYELHFEGDSLRVQLAYDTPFRFAQPVPTPLCPVNDYTDIVVDKLLAFFGRAEPRDAVDMYFILQEVDFWTLAELAAQKDAGFDLYWTANALVRVATFPDEKARWPVQMLKDFEPLELKEQFLQVAQEIMKRISPES